MYISNNTAQHGSGVMLLPPEIELSTSPSTVATFVSCILEDNKASGVGGAFYIGQSIYVTINDSIHTKATNFDHLCLFLLFFPVVPLFLNCCRSYNKIDL